MLESFFNKVFWPYEVQLYLKETSTQVFSCEYCKTFTSSFFYVTPRVAAFVSLIK